MRWSIEELIRSWRIYKEYNALNWFIHFFHRVSRRFKLILNWIFKGYTRESQWGLDHYLMDVFIQRLTMFKNAERDGWPSNLDSFELWEEIIDRLIHGFKVMKSEEYSQSYNKKAKTVIKKIKIGDKEFDSVEFIRTSEQKKEMADAYKKQADYDKETLDLFIKYFRDLWD